MKTKKNNLESTMKKIYWTLVLCTVINFSSIYANENENGGGGVKVNGVYKTFYSAGLVIKSEPETNVPGSKLLLKTINSLVPNGSDSTLLISSALPIGRRAFYRVLEDQMDKKVMEKLIEEYTKVTSQPADLLTLFAITDTTEEITYLLPSFYKLSEVEQAAVLFHEAYWIMKPDANYIDVVSAEMDFQEYVQKTQDGGFSLKLPRLLEKLTNMDEIAIVAALKADARMQTAPDLIHADMKVSIGTLFSNHCFTGWEASPTTGGFIVSKWAYDTKTVCALQKDDLQDLMSISQEYPKSFFIQELMARLLNDKKLEYSNHFVLIFRGMNSENKATKQGNEEAVGFHLLY